MRCRSSAATRLGAGREPAGAGACPHPVESPNIERTHYDVLGVDAGASALELKRAYLRQARRLHPDAHASSSPRTRDRSARAMAGLNESWHVLRDPDRRAAYDRRLLERSHPERATDGQQRTRARRPVSHHRAAATAPRVSATPPRGDSRARVVTEPTTPSRSELGPGMGFRPWLGSTGIIRSEGGGHARYSLAIDGARDLSPLRDLLPDRLMALHAARARIGDEQLAHLADQRGLRLLDLSDTPVGDSGIAHLATCSSLDTLLVWNTRITDRGLELLSQIPTLRVLGLGGVRVTDAGVRALSRLTHLRVLQLYGTDVTGPGLTALDPLRDLELVSLPRRVAPRWRRRLKRAHPALTIT